MGLGVQTPGTPGKVKTTRMCTSAVVPVNERLRNDRVTTQGGDVQRRPLIVVTTVNIR